MRYLPLMLLLFASSLSAAEADLSVGWIARNPKIDYVWNSTSPTVEGWPAAGSTVTWVAHVRWLGADPLQSVSYRWTIDGTVVKSGTLDFAAQSEGQAELPWTWTFDRHEIAFEIDSSGGIGETNERNNRLAVDSDAVGIGLYVERSYWDGVLPMVKAANIGATTFDDWQQIEIRRFNEMARYAVYPETPNGVIERWRIDEIHVVDDGALPIVPPYGEARDWGAGPSALGSLYPDVLDHSVDIQAGYIARSLFDFPEQNPWIFTIGNSIVHELAHARAMVDAYAWSISQNDDVVSIVPAPPADSEKRIYSSHHHGLMHFDWGHIDRYTAAALNRIAGRRALRGNYNEPWDLGWFLDEIPSTNRVRLVHTDGTPIANRNIKVFRAEPDTKSTFYGMQFDNTPELSTTTDGNGVAILPRSVFPDHVTAFIDRTNGTSIVQIDDAPSTRWAFLESLDFNLAYWRGNHDVADYTVTADAPLCLDRLGPSAVSPEPEALITSAAVEFRFPIDANHHYDLHYAVDGGEPVTVSLPVTANSPLKTTLNVPPGHVVWWFTDNDPPVSCPPRHSSIYAFDHDLHIGPRRRAASH